MEIGIDIVDAERFKDLDRTTLMRMFTEREIEYIMQKNYAPETIGGMFAAKEAFFKALGTGISHNRVHDCEILHNSNGAPFYKIGPKIYSEHHNLSTATIKSSISNTKQICIAVAVIAANDLYMPSLSHNKF